MSELRVRRRYWLECIRLRVKDVDFVYNQIVVRDGKGHKDRGTMLPQHVKAPLQRHLHDVTSCMRSAMAALIEIRRSLEGKLSK